MIWYIQSYAFFNLLRYQPGNSHPQVTQFCFLYNTISVNIANYHIYIHASKFKVEIKFNNTYNLKLYNYNS